jgi:hypothetical protein
MYLAVLLLSVVGLALAGGAPAARAAPAERAAPATGVAITSLTAHGVDAAAVPSFAKSLSGGLAAGGLTVTGLDKVRASLKPHAGLQGCETAVCLKRIGMLLQVPLCGKATVEKSGTTTFRIEVVLTASLTGKQIARVERRCELCTLKEAREGLSQAASDAAKKTAGVPGLVPPRMKVRTSPGQRRVVARRVRPLPVTPKFRLVDQGRAWRRWGVITAGAGVTVLIPGIVLMILDGNAKGGGCDNRRCLWDTKGAGAGLIAVGAAALAAGTGLLIYGLIKKRTKIPIPIHVTVGIDPRGSLFVWGQF